MNKVRLTVFSNIFVCKAIRKEFISGISEHKTNLKYIYKHKA